MLEHCAPGFGPLLAGFDPAALDQHQGTVFGLWPDLTLAYFNPAWFAFARDNAGEPAISAQWVLGRHVMDAIPEALQPFYAGWFRQTLAQAAGPRPVVHVYECSSAGIYRRFVMHVYPLRRGTGLLVVNSLDVEQPYAEATGQIAQAPDPSRYLDSQGIVHQCAHCRRIEAVGAGNRWDWVPQWVEHPPASTSHTLCNLCLDHYYPADDDEPPPA